MIKFYKQMALPIVIMFTIPILVMLCCCVELPASDKASSSHRSHDQSPGEAAEHHHDGKDKKSTHSHNECDHSEILGSLVHQTVLIFKEVSSTMISQFTLFKGKGSQELLIVSHSPPFATGPPDHFFSQVPLYLQISVLRI